MKDGASPHNPDGGWQNWRPNRRVLLGVAAAVPLAVLVAPYADDGYNDLTYDPLKETPEELDRRFEGAPARQVGLIEIANDRDYLKQIEREPYRWAYTMPPQDNTLYYINRSNQEGFRELILVTGELDKARPPVAGKLDTRFAQIDFPNHHQPFDTLNTLDALFTSVEVVFHPDVVNYANKNTQVIAFQGVAQSDSIFLWFGRAPVSNPGDMDNSFRNGFRILYEEGVLYRDEQRAVKNATLDPSSRLIYNVQPAS